MAVTAVGGRLTQQHKAGQKAIALQTVAALRKIWALLKFESLDESRPLWLGAALPILADGHQQSQLLAAQYAEAFRSAELPKVEPIVLTTGKRRVSVRVLDPVEFDTAGARLALIATGPARVKALMPAPESTAMRQGFVSSSNVSVRVVGDGGRDVIRRAIDLDRQALGYARVTKADPCWFCAMLASLGAIYKSGNSFAKSDPRFIGPGEVKVHDGCQCTLEPVYVKRAALPGQGAEFATLWRTSTKGVDRGDAVNAFRRAYENRTKPGDPLHTS